MGPGPGRRPYIMIPQSFIQDLLARVDIVEVVERYLPHMLTQDIAQRLGEMTELYGRVPLSSSDAD